MKMKANVASNLIHILNIRLLKVFLSALFVFSIIFILSERVQGQGCSVVLKIKDPMPVCAPSTVDLTLEAITNGSTNGLKFSYYIDPELKTPVPIPSKAVAGTYYIKGMLTDPRTTWIAGSVNVIVWNAPKLVVINPILVNINGTTDLTSESVTSGSDAGLNLSYWHDSAASIPLLSPYATGEGNYFIKGTSGNGCFDIDPVTVKE